jgi:hypothetical protein
MRRALWKMSMAMILRREKNTTLAWSMTRRIIERGVLGLGKGSYDNGGFMENGVFRIWAKEFFIVIVAFVYIAHLIWDTWSLGK